LARRMASASAICTRIMAANISSLSESISSGVSRQYRRKWARAS
jgi:hypothetical protein